MSVVLYGCCTSGRNPQNSKSALPLSSGKLASDSVFSGKRFRMLRGGSAKCHSVSPEVSVAAAWSVVYRCTQAALICANGRIRLLAEFRALRFSCRTQDHFEELFFTFSCIALILFSSRTSHCILSTSGPGESRREPEGAGGSRRKRGLRFSPVFKDTTSQRFRQEN